VAVAVPVLVGAVPVAVPVGADGWHDAGGGASEDCIAGWGLLL